MPKMGKWTDTNLKNNLALVVSIYPVEFQIDWTKRLQLKVWKPKYFRQADAQNGQMEALQFWQQPSPSGVLLPC